MARHSFLPRLTDDGAEVLLLDLGGLECLDISGCTGLTERTLDVVRYHALELTTLSVANCPKFSQAKLDYLERVAHKLTLLRSTGEKDRRSLPAWVANANDTNKAKADDDRPPAPTRRGATTRE